MARKPEASPGQPAEPREALRDAPQEVPLGGAPQSVPLDEQHGQGGSYIVNEAGQRVLVERTELPKEPTGDDTPAAASEE